MSCKCIRETGEKLRLRLAAPEMDSLRPRNATSVAPTMVNARDMALMWSSGQWKLNIPYLVEWEGVKKPSTINMIATHCPFCGAAFPEDKETK